MRNFAEKLKSDKKARAVVICTSLAAVALIAAAIAIPVVIHNNRIPKEAQAAQTTTPSELTTREVSTTQAVTVPETAESTEPPTTAPTTAASVSNSGQNSKPTSDTTKKSSSGSSGASSSTPKPNTGSSNQKPVTATQAQGHQWTQAEVDEVIAETKAYAISKGFKINSNMTIQGTSWNNPINTSWYSYLGSEAVTKVKSRLKEEIDWNYNQVVNEIGYFPKDLIGINVVSLTGVDHYYDIQVWEIYVVY